MIAGAVRKSGSSGLPKWLVLEAGEKYEKSILTRQVLFTVLMAMVAVISVAVAVALVVSHKKEGLSSLGLMLGSLSTVGTAFGTSKLYITNRRLVLELKRKFAGEIRLDSIKAMQIDKGLLGGKLLVVPAQPGAGAIQVSVLRPNELAEQIQRLAEGSAAGTSQPTDKFPAGGGK